MGPRPSVTRSFRSPGFSVHRHLHECISKPRPSLGRWKFGSLGLSRGCGRSRGAESLSLAQGLLPHQTGAPTGSQASPSNPAPPASASAQRGQWRHTGWTGIMSRCSDSFLALRVSVGEPPPEQVGKETKCTSIGEAAAESLGSLVCLRDRTTPPGPNGGSKGPSWRWPPRPSAMRRPRVVGLLLCASGALFARREL